MYTALIGLRASTPIRCCCSTSSAGDVHEQKSIGEIVRNLNAQKIPTRRGAPRWDRATVWAILQNLAHVGKAAFGKTEATERRKLLRPIRSKAITPRRSKSAHRDKPPEQWISIDVPAIVTRDVFDASKGQLARNKQLSQRNARGEQYLLQGLTACSRCGYAFYGKTVSKSAAKGGARYAYYRCVGGDSYRFAGGRVCCKLVDLQRRLGMRRTWSVHALRHAFCSHLVRVGVGVEAVRALAGHSSIRITNRYVHATGADLQGAIQRGFRRAVGD